VKLPEISKQGWDARVGIGHKVLRYVQQLEWGVKELETRLSNAERLHAQELTERDQRIAGQQRQISKLRQQLRLAEEKLRTSSQNSSKPPSSDPPSKTKRVVRAATGKRRGGQAGHAFHERKLIPAELVTAMTDHRPERCAKCNASLNGDDANPLRHQVIEIPMPQAQVFEHRLHSLQCEYGAPMARMKKRNRRGCG
jgi:transposase